MEEPLKKIFRERIRLTNADEFQERMLRLYQICYGQENVKGVRRTHDGGADILFEPQKAVIACYGPRDTEPKRIAKKINDDHQSYSKNWKELYPNWIFLVNHELTPNEITDVALLGGSAKGLDEIMCIVSDELMPGDRRKFGRELGIGDDFFARDTIRELLDAILVECDDGKVKYAEPPDIEAKIRENFQGDDIDLIIDEFQECLIEVPFIQQIYAAYEPKDIGAIKNRVRDDYDTVSGEIFRLKFDALLERYKHKYARDDDYAASLVKCILIYIFHQCLIGLEPPRQ